MDDQEISLNSGKTTFQKATGCDWRTHIMSLISSEDHEPWTVGLALSGILGYSQN